MSDTFVSRLRSGKFQHMSFQDLWVEFNKAIDEGPQDLELYERLGMPEDEYEEFQKFLNLIKKF